MNKLKKKVACILMIVLVCTSSSGVIDTYAAEYQNWWVGTRNNWLTASKGKPSTSYAGDVEHSWKFYVNKKGIVENLSNDTDQEQLFQAIAPGTVTITAKDTMTYLGYDSKSGYGFMTETKVVNTWTIKVTRASDGGNYTLNGVYSSIDFEFAYIFDTESQMYGAEITEYTDDDVCFVCPISVENNQMGKLAIISIGDNAFRYQDVEGVQLEEYVCKIGKRAFAGCENLRIIKIPVSVRYIGEDAFKGCDQLVIYCVKGSYAEEYAKTNNLNYVVVTEDQMSDNNIELWLKTPPTPAATATPTATPVPTPVPEDAPLVQGDTVTGYKGEEVEMTVSIKNNPGITAAGVNISYDTNAMELLSVENGTVMQGTHFTTSDDITRQPYRMVWVSGTKDITANGTLATLKFKLNDDVQAGDYLVSITYDEDDYYNTAFNNVSFVVADGVVRVVDYITGDVNGDNKVNTKDAARILQYCAGWSITINLQAADVNKDGKVNTKDAALVLQKAAGWNVGF